MLVPGRALGLDELVVPARCGARGDSVGDPAAEAYLGAAGPSLRAGGGLATGANARVAFVGACAQWRGAVASGTRRGSWVRERALAARVRWLLARCVEGADGAARGGSWGAGRSRLRV